MQSKFFFCNDGKHPKARFSLSAGVKRENFMRVKIKNDIKQGIEEYYITWRTKIEVKLSLT